MLPTYIFGERPEHPRLFARTMRALLQCEATALTTANAELLAAADGPVRLLRAGAWPRRAVIEPPPRSATGRPLCAVGAIVTGAPSLRAPWDAALSKCGGELSALSADRLPVVSSVVLEAAAARALAREIAVGARIEVALHRVVSSPQHRAVRLPALDVGDDPGLRVMLAVTSLQQGGAERVALELLRGLPLRGVTTELLALGRTARKELQVPPDVIARVCTKASREDRLAEIGQRALSFGADVLHAHLFSGGDLRALVASCVPIAATIHNARNGWQPGVTELSRAEIALLIACALSVEDELAAELVARNDGPRTRTIWNGVAAPEPATESAREKARRAFEVPAGALVIVAIANPRAQKRLELLPEIAQAAEAVLSRKVITLVAGSPGGDADSISAERALREAIAAHGAGERVRCLGAVSDVPTLLAAADVLVAPSAWEGLSLSQLEALAAGVAVVTTSVGGASEVAARAPGMHLVAVDASPAVYADAIARALAHGVRPSAPPDFLRAKMLDRHAELLRRVACTASKPAHAPDGGVYFVMNNVSTGGAQSSARRLALGLAEAGVRARFGVLQEREENPTPGLLSLRAAGIPVFVPPPDEDAAITVGRLLSDMDQEATRAVLFWNVMPQHQLLFADGCLDVPMICVSPGEMLFTSLAAYFEKPRAGLPYRDGRDLGRRLAACVVKYRAEEARAAAFFGTQVRVIPNGVPLMPRREQRARREGPLVLGTAARISPQKKLGELIDAVHIAHDRMPPYVLRIAGAPERGAHEHARQLRDRAEGLPIEWVGERAPVQPFLAELDLFVMISEPAGCPNASLEAMSAGLPMVATAVGGAIDQIVHGETGLLTPPANAAALADALIEATRDPERLLAWGRGGRDRAESLFDVDRMVRDYVALVREVS